jgi:hypothetical protein
MLVLEPTVTWEHQFKKPPNNYRRSGGGLNPLDLKMFPGFKVGIFTGKTMGI